MKLSNALKKIKRELKCNTIQKDNHFTTRYKGQVLEFYANGRVHPDQSITCIRVRGVNDEDDCITDYCAGSFYPNLNQAIKWGLKYGN
jgi:hypothetical protein